MSKLRFARVFVVAMVVVSSIALSDTVVADVKNLLPNASFELPFGQGLPWNWLDMFNPLTMKLVAIDQVPQGYPDNWWKGIEGGEDLPDGLTFMRLPVPEGQPGYLTSAMVRLKPGQAYALSAYARSDLPSARLTMTMWTRPLDWRVAPDAQGQAQALTSEWQRYEMTFTAPTYADRGVVAMVAMADRGGTISVDAVQLEEGPAATPFETRFPVETAITADRPFNGMLHVMDEPLELYVSHACRDAGEAGQLTLSIETLGGNVVYTSKFPGPAEPGHDAQKLSLDFPLLGQYRARVLSAEGDDIQVSSYGYLFFRHPVMKRGFQGILYSRDGKVGELPAERVSLPWENTKTQYADPWSMGITDEGTIYMYALGRSEILRSRDGGRTWEAFHGHMSGVLRNGTILSGGFNETQRRFTCSASTDEGKTWKTLGSSDPIETSATQAGSITELADGTLIWPLGYAKSGATSWSVYAHRSTDGGGTWSKGYPICPGGEPFVTELRSGRLLAVCRNHPVPIPADAWRVYAENEDKTNWRLGMRAMRRDGPLLPKGGLYSLHKNLLLADSDDEGLTWKNVRPGTTDLDTMHGSAVELPDGRIVLIHVQRWPTWFGGEWAKTSRDGGNTWDPETYYLSSALSPGYSASCVLPPELADGKPGMILTVLGYRRSYHPTLNPKGDIPARLEAVRWLPLPRD